MVAHGTVVEDARARGIVGRHAADGAFAVRGLGGEAPAGFG